MAMVVLFVRCSCCAAEAKLRSAKVRYAEAKLGPAEAKLGSVKVVRYGLTPFSLQHLFSSLLQFHCCYNTL